MMISSNETVVLKKFKILENLAVKILTFVSFSFTI